MTITYPLTLPTHTGQMRVTFRQINAVASPMSPFTFVGQKQVYPGQMWEIDVELPPMFRSNAEKWIAWLVSLKGYGTFYLGDQLAKLPMGSARDTDSISVKGDTSSGETLSIKGVPENQTGYLKAGDYVHTGNGNNRQLFKVLADVDTDGFGEATLDVWPDIRTSLEDGDSVTAQNAQGIFCLVDPIQSWSVNNVAKFGITFSARESI